MNIKARGFIIRQNPSFVNQIVWESSNFSIKDIAVLADRGLFDFFLLDSKASKGLYF